jgi:hypothetical protein
MNFACVANFLLHVLSKNAFPTTPPSLAALLSDFAAAEQSLAVLITWLVEQAARLRAALAALLLQLALIVEHWQLPQGLLLPLPAAAGALQVRLLAVFIAAAFAAAAAVVSGRVFLLNITSHYMC